MALRKYEINEVENGFVVHIGNKQDGDKTPYRKRFIARSITIACDLIKDDYMNSLN